MKYTNPIPKETRKELRELVKLKKALIKKGVITNAEIKKEKSI